MNQGPMPAFRPPAGGFPQLGGTMHPGPIVGGQQGQMQGNPIRARLMQLLAQRFGAGQQQGANPFFHPMQGGPMQGGPNGIMQQAPNMDVLSSLQPPPSVTGMPLQPGQPTSSGVGYQAGMSHPLAMVGQGGGTALGGGAAGLPPSPFANGFNGGGNFQMGGGLGPNGIDPNALRAALANRLGGGGNRFGSGGPVPRASY